MQQINDQAPGWHATRLGRIATVMQRHVDERRLPVLAVKLVQHGQEVYRGVWHGPDIANNAWSDSSIVRMYSMSKPITTVAALTLYEQGAFQLDDPIEHYMPAFGDMLVLTGGSVAAPALERAATPITIRHLMMHTCGIVYPEATGELIQQLYAQAGARVWTETIAEMADKLAGLPLAHQPGTAWHYGLSIDLLGRLIEVISGQSLGVFMRERLFAPLGMIDTGFEVAPAQRGRLSPCYGPGQDSGFAVCETPFDSGDAPAFLCGGGGLFSTLDDYGRFCQMLLDGGELDGQRILSPKAVALMSMNHTPLAQIPVVPPSWPFREGYGMALGVRTLVDVAASQALGSVGTTTWQGAASTDYWVDPQEDFYGICLSQMLPGQYRPARDFRVLAYQAMVG